MAVPFILHSLDIPILRDITLNGVFMIFSSELKFIFLHNQSINTYGLHRQLITFTDIHHYPNDPTVQSITQNFKNTFTNKYWGTQTIVSNTVLFNLQSAIDSKLIDEQDLTPDLAIYAVIADPVRRFMDMCKFVKDSGFWIRMLFESEFNAVSSPVEFSFPLTIRLDPIHLLPTLNPDYQRVYKSLSYQQIGERIINFPFVAPAFDTLRMPQCYYDDPRVTLIGYPNFVETFNDICVTHNLPIRYTFPDPAPNLINESDFTADFLDKVRLVYAEDVELYNKLMLG